MNKLVLSFIFIFGFSLFLVEANAEINSSIPDWIKNNASWWADDNIDDATFVQSIEYLIKENIITDIQPEKITQTSTEIPDWIKSNAGWWADNQIPDSTFLDGIKFLIKNGIITISNSNCDENEDTNRNGIPDATENVPVLLGITSDEFIKILTKTSFVNKDWSNCIFQGDLSYYIFNNVNLTNATFLNTKLSNSHFYNSTLIGTTFSNNVLYGASFSTSNLSDVVFENSDFYIDDWEHPFYVYNYNNLKTNLTCFQNPCLVYYIPYTFESEKLAEFYRLTFGDNFSPYTLRLADGVFDNSDKRTIWRNVAGFINSEMNSVVFENSDLSNSMFINIKLSNAEFNDSNLSNVLLDGIQITNTKIGDEYFGDSTIIDQMIMPKIKSNIHINDIYYEKIPNPKNIDIDINFVDVIDEGLINWSMGLVIHGQKLYVADTDDHFITVYDLNTLERIFDFSSPIQHNCDSTNLYSKTIESCPIEKRNLPTSIVILDENIFVAYGFQNDIQVFDMEGNFLYKFGKTGNQNTEFNSAYRISEYENMLYVADSGNHRIQIFDSDGKFLKQFSTNVNNNTTTPYDLDIYNNRIFVLDRTNSSILIFDIDGILLNEFLIDSDLPNNSLSGIDIHDELIFVANSENNMISILDLDGNIVMNIGKLGHRYGEFSNPQKVISNDGKIFVSDAQNYRIQIFDLVYPITP